MRTLLTVTAERIISHPDYSDNAFNNDICLIRVPNLSSTSPNSVNVWSPACLPTQPPPAYKHCWVAGWGTTSLGGNISNKMREAGVNIFSPEECLKTGYSSTQLDFDTEFCAGIPDFNGDGVTDGGKDACQGKNIFVSLPHCRNGLMYFIGFEKFIKIKNLHLR